MTLSNTTRSDHWSFRGLCTCKIVWTQAIGSHEVGTDEWLPNKSTVHVHLEVNNACPIHTRAHSD